MAAPWLFAVLTFQRKSGGQCWTESNFLRRPDLEFINKMVDKTAIARLQQIATTPFERCTYTRAIEILEEVVKSKKKKFEFPVCMLSLLNQQCLSDISRRTDLCSNIVRTKQFMAWSEAHSLTQGSRKIIMQG